MRSQTDPGKKSIEEVGAAGHAVVLVGDVLIGGNAASLHRIAPCALRRVQIEAGGRVSPHGRQSAWADRVTRCHLGADPAR